MKTKMLIVATAIFVSGLLWFIFANMTPIMYNVKQIFITCEFENYKETVELTSVDTISRLNTMFTGRFKQKLSDACPYLGIKITFVAPDHVINFYPATDGCNGILMDDMKKFNISDADKKWLQALWMSYGFPEVMG